MFSASSEGYQLLEASSEAVKNNEVKPDWLFYVIALINALEQPSGLVFESYRLRGLSKEESLCL